jgi:excinuclease UvrABC nuclease subunit
MYLVNYAQAPHGLKNMHLLCGVRKQGFCLSCPGCTFFLDAAGDILYIGKATSLRDRVRSYFSGDIFETRGPKIVFMLERAASIAFRETDSVLEALLLESDSSKSISRLQYG